MSGILSFAALFLVAMLTINWLVIIVAIVAGWLVGKFKERKIARGIVVLILLIAMPLGAALLTRSFFRTAFSGGEDGMPAFLTGGINSVLEDSALGNSAGDSGLDPEDPAASADAAVSDANARKPEDYSDEELLALAEECFDDMFSMKLQYMNDRLIPTDYNDVIGIRSQQEDYGGTYSRVKDYTTLEEVETVLEEIWYGKFAWKYPVDLMRDYVSFRGAVYVGNPATGGPGAPFILDGILSRADDEVAFTGHWEYEDGQTLGVMEFSLVYEDGRWKYGYCDSVPRERWPE